MAADDLIGINSIVGKQRKDGERFYRVILPMDEVGMHIGYARVSTHEQHLELQQDALQRAGCTKILVDRVSGTVAERPGLAQIKELLRPGDTLVV